MAFQWNYEHLSQETRAYLESLPQQAKIQVGGFTALLVHGSPDSIDEHLGSSTPETRFEELAAAAQVDLIACGHSHEAFVKRSRDVVRQSRQRGTPRRRGLAGLLCPVGVRRRRVEGGPAAGGVRHRARGPGGSGGGSAGQLCGCLSPGRSTRPAPARDRPVQDGCEARVTSDVWLTTETSRATNGRGTISPPRSTRSWPLRGAATTSRGTRTR